MARGRFPRPLRREGPDVHLVNDLSLEAHAGPGGVPPGERRWIDDLRGAQRALRLEAGDGIGEEHLFFIQEVAVQRAVPGAGDEVREVAVSLRLQGARIGGWGSRPALQDQGTVCLRGAQTRK